MNFAQKMTNERTQEAARNDEAQPRGRQIRRVSIVNLS